MNIYRLTIINWQNKHRTKYVTEKSLRQTLVANQFSQVYIERAPIGEFVDVTGEYR